jgi:hypothetical protein
MSIEKEKVLEMLVQAQDARWERDRDHIYLDREFRIADEHVLLGRVSALEEVAKLAGASEQEIQAANCHALCPQHHAHACVSCKFACLRCWGTYEKWTSKNALTAM